jgi:hypothetical protein
MALPALALNADYYVAPNGSAYTGYLQVEKSTGYQFYEVGAIGERVPVKATDIILSGTCSPCTYNMSGDSGISYPEGNYTISYRAPVRESHLLFSYDRPYNVSVSLPEGLDVRNPLLGVISQGGKVSSPDNTSVIVNWTGARSAEIRFYDQERESLLYMFGNFWIVIAIVLLAPFLFTWRRKKRE